MQDIWKAKLDWDSPLPPQLHKHWIKYCKELQVLETFKVPRCYIHPQQSFQNVKYELHGFSDASKVAYSACIYIRTIDCSGENSVTLVCAKSRVAPVKSETIPRLELCGAVLLTRLMITVQESLKLNFSLVRCWTDSTIVLDWLASSEKLPVFVANRIIQIQSIFPSHQWFHVPGEENPADCASRGISSAALLSHPLWLHGPSWLLTTIFSFDSIALVAHLDRNSSVLQFINNCSSYSKSRRVIAYCLRFISNSRKSKEDRNFGVLTALEISSALTSIVSCVQAESFSEEIRHLQKKLPTKSNIKYLSPFLDEKGILRVGGRLRNSSLLWSQKHPILLPQKHNFTDVVVKYFHLNLLHAAPQLLLASIREQFWIIRGPDVVRHAVRKCVVCHRHNVSTPNQLMGQLPSPRVKISRPFSQCGVDYAGPFILCVRPGRNPTHVKAYVSVFVCMATHAVHLEYSGDLSTSSFIGALQRFIARRGIPQDIFSDQGTNFVGAKNEIYEIQNLLRSQSHLDSFSNFSAEKGIKFHFNPPASPHHGGLWEAAVKSMKRHLHRVLEDRKPSIEEFVTLLAQVESCLNSRPLTSMSSDPNDFCVLTPGHFLVGDSLSALPQLDSTHVLQNRLARWQSVQQMFQHFWRRWNNEYLRSLQIRPKWFSSTPDIKVGTLVLVCDHDPAWEPLKWKLARISAVFPGPDGLVRVCEVKTANGSVLKRPIVKLSPLPIEQ